MPKATLKLVLLAVLPAAVFAADQKPLGEIDFFGNKGIDISAIRSALPFHEGEPFPPATAKPSDDLKRQVSEIVKQVTGHDPTSVTFVCCDAKQNWMIFIGLAGASYQPITFHSAPTGEIRFPKPAFALGRNLEKATRDAVMKGNSSEDDSQGFALSKDPAAKEAALALREYALQNEPLILQVLASSSDARHRAAAAQMLGYARQSPAQIDALVQASLDSDEGVRNDATRALGVLVHSKPALAQSIPPGPFIGLIRSGSWTDHNKASLLLDALTESRDPKVLATLRAQALDSLLEMAQWRSIGHATASLMILGRIAGIDESQLYELIPSGKTDVILSRFNR